MEPEELVRRMSDLQVVDVRYPNEWEAGRIEGAIHVPADELEDRLPELERSRPVVTVCRTGARSAEAAEFLAEEGFQAENLDGGMEAWASAGRSVVTAGGEPGTVAEPEPPPDDRPEHVQRLQGEFLQVLFAVQEHFGDEEPSDEDIRAFLRERMLNEGRSAEEADEILARMGDPPSGAAG